MNKSFLLRNNEVDLTNGFLGYFNTSIPIKQNANHRDSDLLTFRIIRKEIATSPFCLLATEGSMDCFFYGEMFNAHELCERFSIATSENFPTFSNIDLQLYKKFGENGFTNIDGFFLITLIDRSKNEFQIFADRYAATYPLFFTCSSKKTAFSSSLPLLLKIQSQSIELNENGIFLFLKYGYIPSPYTIYKGVNKLKPGETVRLRNGQVDVYRYDNFHVSTSQISLSDAIDRYEELLTLAIKQRFAASTGERIGFFLSGGLDSSMNVALAAKTIGKNFGLVRRICG